MPGQISAPGASTLFGYDPSSQLYLPVKVRPLATDPVNQEDYAILSALLESDYPAGSIPVSNSSGNQSNAVATATLPAVAAKTTYIAGFQVTGSGSTAALVVSVTVVNTVGGTMTYTYTFVIGVAVPNQPLVVQFLHAIPATAVNTTIAVSCPAGGAGNTNNTVNAQGYQL